MARIFRKNATRLSREIVLRDNEAVTRARDNDAKENVADLLSYAKYVCVCVCVWRHNSRECSVLATEKEEEEEESEGKRKKSETTFCGFCRGTKGRSPSKNPGISS